MRSNEETLAAAVVLGARGAELSGLPPLLGVPLSRGRLGPLPNSQVPQVLQLCL